MTKESVRNRYGIEVALAQMKAAARMAAALRSDEAIG
jgi:hypothetical protein